MVEKIGDAAAHFLCSTEAARARQNPKNPWADDASR
jgi:hypothetical protein